ncbi:MAG: radical SAM protein [Pseudomonadota bacterium]
MGSRHAAGKKQALARDPAAAAFFRKNNYTPSPLIVQWMATQGCSLSCPHCLCGEEGPPADELSFDEACGLVDQAAAMGAAEFLVTGGEPLERADLPGVIHRMRERGLRWSLNTSAFPGRALRNAMEKHPPCFAAVSLDGPREFHDAFRGRRGAYDRSMEALGYFARLTGGNATAGTTVSARNLGLLDDTFAAVLESGATAWGLHLTFPEGKAKSAPGLALTRKQLRRFLAFAQAKQRYFPVVLADEIGFCGGLEPEVRQTPFFCGAGRAQLVVLSDGEVVPCTTVDRSESAGNIRALPMEEIWHSGFAEIRAMKLPKKCTSCDYAPACGGGCWLQRRAGRQCFRDVWEKPRSYAAAAGLALCLGLAACSHGEAPSERQSIDRLAGSSLAALTLAQPGTLLPEIKAKPSGKKAAKAPAKAGADAGADLPLADNPGALETAILAWYFDKSCLQSPPAHYKPGKKKESLKLDEDKKLASDPAGKYLEKIKAGKYPNKLVNRAKRITAALKTGQRSLAFSALLWRDLMLWCFNGTPPKKRTDEEKKLLARTLEAIEKKTEKWRSEIYEKKLDTFISTDPAGRAHFFMRSKGYNPVEHFNAAKAELSMEHWGLEKHSDELTKEHMKAHPFGEAMSLEFEIVHAGHGLERLAGSGSVKVKKKDRLGIFDILVVPPSGKKGEITIRFTSGDKTFDVKLPPETQLLYGDVLRLVYEQNRIEMDAVIENEVKTCSLAAGPHALYLPALESRLANLPEDMKSLECNYIRKALNIWLF